MNQDELNQGESSQNKPYQDQPAQDGRSLGLNPESDVESSQEPASTPAGTEPLVGPAAAPVVVPPLPTAASVPAPVLAPVTPTATPRKSHKKAIILISVLSILLLAAIGVITYLLLFPPQQDKTANNSTQNTTSSALTASELVEKVRSAVKDQLGSTYPDMKITDSTNTPAYKDPAAGYAVANNDKGFGFTVDLMPNSPTDSTNTEVTAIAADILRKVDNVKTIEKSWATSYQNDNILCTVSDNDLHCADITVYASVISDLAPFAKAYLASADGQKYGDTIVMTTADVQDGSNGYRLATSPMGSTESPTGGFAGLFYGKNGNWTYWRGTQDFLPCSAYDTKEVQQAYEGDDCYDTATGSTTATVKVTL